MAAAEPTWLACLEPDALAVEESAVPLVEKRSALLRAEALEWAVEPNEPWGDALHSVAGVFCAAHRSQGASIMPIELEIFLEPAETG